MADVPDDLKYSEDHEWVRYDENSGVATIGITDYAQGELGDIVYLELPDVGTEVRKKETAGTIEAVKAVAELYAPVSGKIVEVNRSLEEKPETVNKEPYGDGWMLRVEVTDASELDDLMDASGYRDHIG